MSVQPSAQWLKPTVFLVLTAPLAWLAWQIWQEAVNPTNRLGADPVATVVSTLGIWSIRFLLLTLLVSPLRRLTGWSALARLRRMVGLFAFAYVSLHLLSFVGLILVWDLAALWIEVQDRPYVTLGFGAFVLLLCLAVTSTRGWQRRLQQRWRKLHRAIFPATLLALAHWLWLTKDGYGEVLLYCLVCAVLFTERIVFWFRRSRRASQQPSVLHTAGTGRG